eukprot:Platyproteum_vivax@DN7394_c0_g1_i11.p1
MSASLKGRQRAQRPWSREEDTSLLELVSTFGTSKWTEVSTHLYDRTKIQRLAKQCRERWISHVDPDIKRGENWSPSEDSVLIAYQVELGNRWAEISRRLKDNTGTGRTTHAVKNRFHRLSRAREDLQCAAKTACEKVFGMEHPTTLLAAAASAQYEQQQMVKMRQKIRTTPPTRYLEIEAPQYKYYEEPVLPEYLPDDQEFLTPRSCISEKGVSTCEKATGCIDEGLCSEWSSPVHQTSSQGEETIKLVHDLFPALEEDEPMSPLCRDGAEEFPNLASSSESTLRLFEEPIDALDEWVWSGRGIDDMRDENIRTGGDDRRSGESVETRSLERSVETGDTWSMKRIMPSTPVQYPLSKRQETPVMYPWTPHRDLSKNNYNWNIPASYDTTV